MFRTIHHCSIIRLRHCCNLKTTPKHQFFDLSTSLAYQTEPEPLASLPFSNSLSKRRELANLLQLPLSKTPIPYYTRLHGSVIVFGFHHDVYLSNILLHCYSKSGCLDYGRKLFDEMPERDLVTWSSVISMYSQHGLGREGLELFVEFRRSSIRCSNGFILTSVIRGCTLLGGGLSHGSQVHGFVVKSGFDLDAFVGTALVDFYAKNGDVDDARLVFDGLVEKTAVTWTTMITGYVNSGRSEVGLQLFAQMRDGDVVPDRFVVSSALSACSALKFIEGGKQIHAHVIRRGAEMDVSVLNVLVDLYTKCGKVRIARMLFDQMTVKNVISWTTMIAGYMQNSFDREAMAMLAEMNRLGWRPDGFACTSILTSCGSLEALREGKQVHAYAIKVNLEFDGFVRNGLIDMYAKCNSLENARKVFDAIVDPNIVSYNAMIEGYSRMEQVREALDVFHEMRFGSFQPTALTFVSILGVSAALLTLELSRQIHGLMIKSGVALSLFAGSALIDSYCKSVCIKDARLVFDEMTVRDIVVWNAMFSGYTQQMENEEALKLFFKFQLSGQQPNEFTFAALVTPASNLASLKHGQQFHGQIIMVGLDQDSFVVNALIDMYSKCGCIDEARKAFDSSYWRDPVCWNSIIMTYAQHGEAQEALEIFDEMREGGIIPNYVTYVSVLSACSHAGLVDVGLHHFESMTGSGIEPGIEHYACIVSLFGRAGRLSQARDFIEKMPIQPAPIVWRSLLSACRSAGDVELGKYAADMAISMDPMDSGSYTLLSNIFASKGMWQDVKKVRERMDKSGVVKEPGQSWLEVNTDVHVFVSRDRSHSQADIIMLVLDGLILHMREIGYVPDTRTEAND